ncbi:hypothetical protein, partial [Microcystis aeruginosa]|uniref:hypothetical protein n=1 Tax=Microcystis aeruginosa TaxID=1126 RepID=UPI001C4070A5
MPISVLNTVNKIKGFVKFYSGDFELMSYLYIYMLEFRINQQCLYNIQIVNVASGPFGDKRSLGNQGGRETGG